MNKSTRFLAASAAFICAASLQAQAQTPPPAPLPTVRAEVGNPLKEAETLLIAKKPAEALAKIAEAEKIANRTPYENFIIERMRAGAALGAGDDALAFRSLAAAAESGMLTAEESPKIHDAVARIAYRSKDYPNAILWAERTQKLPGANPDLQSLIVNSQYFSKDYAAAMKGLRAVVAEMETRGTKPPEDRLRMWAASANQLKDDKAYVVALEKLAVNYPKTEYWADLLYRVDNAPGFSEKLILDAYRLRLAAGALTKSTQYFEMASILSAAAFPAEAQQVIDKGVAAGLWGGGAESARAQKLRETVARDLKDEQARGNSTPPKTAIAYMNNGMDQVVKGDAAKGLALMEQAITLPDQKRPDEAKLRLGIAYVAAGNNARAEEVFKTVRGGEGLSELARAWMLFAQRGGK